MVTIIRRTASPIFKEEVTSATSSVVDSGGTTTSIFPWVENFNGLGSSVGLFVGLDVGVCTGRDVGLFVGWYMGCFVGDDVNVVISTSDCEMTSPDGVWTAIVTVSSGTIVSTLISEVSAT